MKNVYDLLYEKNLMFILPEDVCANLNAKKNNAFRNVAVIVHLYYPDTLKEYFQHIDNIPKEIKTYIISSNEEIFEEVEKYINEKENRYFIKKENRGRDVSALLVAANEIFLGSEICCFVHDKKEHVSEGEHKGLKTNTRFWVTNLWDNTLKSEEYIQNVLNVFYENEQIGVLVPPEPIGECRDEWYSNAWGRNIENTRNLAEMLEICADISDDKPPITLGTVFWCRTKSLQKLFDKKWEYTDFPEEPLPGDGTISHAIERIFAYVAQDAGYDTGFVMCNSYAQRLLLFAKQTLTYSQNLVYKAYGVSKLYQMKNLEVQKAEIEVFFDLYDEVYLYGPGYLGQEFLKVLKCWGYMPHGFLVSPGRMEQRVVETLPIYELSEMTGKDKKGVIITVRKDLQKEFADNLRKYGFENYMACLFTF